VSSIEWAKRPSYNWLGRFSSTDFIATAQRMTGRLPGGAAVVVKKRSDAGKIALPLNGFVC